MEAIIRFRGIVIADRAGPSHAKVWGSWKNIARAAGIQAPRFPAIHFRWPTAALRDIVAPAMALLHTLGWDPLFLQRSALMWPLARAARWLQALRDWPSQADFDALYAELTAHLQPPEPLRFVANVRKQDKRAHGAVVLDALYDARIARFGEVPTRERDWHDVFNALCFASFPRAKLALHRRQLAALERRLQDGLPKLPGARTREHDALTLFDEGGVAVAATAEAAAALAHAEPGPLPELLQQLEQAGAARTVPFGHALFEHLVEGLVAPGGGTRVIVLDALPDTPEALRNAVDAGLCQLLRDPQLFQSPKEQLHLRFGRMRMALPNAEAPDWAATAP